MKPNRRFIGAAFASASLLGAAATLSPASAASTVVVGATETISSHNPHGDSISMGYGI